MFSDIARRNPRRPAIVHNGHALSYGRLLESANALATRLGPDPGAVAVPAVHAPETVVALLGVLTAGGTYCPVDPAFPAARRQAMAAAAQCRTAVSGRSGDILRLDARLVELPEPTEFSGDPPASPPAGSARAEPEQPAYILFTSGSTGQPKPVVTPRRAVAATAHALRELFHLAPEDRVLQFASLNWDTCFEEILPALTGGAALVIDPDAHSGSFPRLLRLVERERITVLDLPTAFWHELVHHLVDSGDRLPSCLRLVVIGGEAAGPARLADWARLQTGRIRLLNTYGCTETTQITHAVDLAGPLAPGRTWDGTTRAPIGRALPHVVEHLDEHGELLIGGPALALGYLGLPEATAARFTTLDCRRFFRTGDRMSRDPDGLLTHQGRLDGELKVRGIRVDPAEVEAHLTGHPDVTAAAVTGTTVAGRTTLVAYVVARPHTPARQLDRDLLSHLRARVPGHLVPSRITLVPRLVHTPSGKVDRAGCHLRYAAPPDRSKETSLEH
ncbi:amino acid adenylation domain-containing protein [Streptomyces sp. NRRL S-350]|uniref:amino acid adenylation domain-containing protein n=1 Tax=Streptomyces sp. NRRL S-350 TaxID=1463902 RepID=UPI001F1C49F2|nr:amino acid adenylation domain-containing protein [Streptomyces sp. NRRL S-350]